MTEKLLTGTLSLNTNKTSIKLLSEEEQEGVRVVDRVSC